MSIAPGMPSAEDGAIHISHLPLERRLAFGRWVRAVYGLVEHLDQCPFGCTAEEQRCLDGIDAVDLERLAWEDWRAAVEAD